MSEEVRVGVRHAVNKLFARFSKTEVVEELQRVIKRESAPPVIPVESPAAEPEEPEANLEQEAEPPPIQTSVRGTGRKKY